MPIYEYRCIECGDEFEEILKIGDPNPVCKNCNGKTEKLVSHCSGVVKGSEHRLLDCVVGEDAERRRGYLEKRKEKRRMSQKTNQGV
jgi:putative FmdB family regulatory protein